MCFRHTTAVSSDSTWQFPVMVKEMHYDHKADFTVMSGEGLLQHHGAPFLMSLLNCDIIMVSEAYSLQGRDIK